ncbi:class I hydrophobin superfamily [Pleurotus ostreatus PC15]|uniref:Class I hydrophobin 18 n=1 Tax=Pleurotus ostreatus (strain PC15) TaxID=1137138 RepID=HYD18_PLEO1|nr:class I hydrophobin superfamily [Pleurotus ostreatus PC15]
MFTEQVLNVIILLQTATVTATAIPASGCNAGDVQCCKSVQKADSAGGAALLGLVGIVLSNLDVFIGGDCSPITAIGVGGTSCSSQAVCCENNSFNGLIALGCVPINLSL